MEVQAWDADIGTADDLIGSAVLNLRDRAADEPWTLDKWVTLTRKGKEIAKFPRKGGLYVMQVRVKKPKNEEPKNGNDRPAKDFSRQGVNR
jgi:hypothetical protein